MEFHGDVRIVALFIHRKMSMIYYRIDAMMLVEPTFSSCLLKSQRIQIQIEIQECWPS